MPQVARQSAAKGMLLTQNEGDTELLSRLIVECAKSHQFSLHAFVVLQDEYRLLGSGALATSLPLTMQAVSRRYVAPYNKRSGRSGALFASRFRSTVIEPETWLLKAMAVIEHAPVAKGLVADAAHYPWSSYRHHVGLATDMALTDHREYWRLGNTPFERQRIYLARSAALVSIDAETQLLAAIDTGWALGSAEYIARVSPSASRRLAPSKRGRRVG